MIEENLAVSREEGVLLMQAPVGIHHGDTGTGSPRDGRLDVPHRTGRPDGRRIKIDSPVVKRPRAGHVAVRFTPFRRLIRGRRRADPGQIAGLLRRHHRLHRRRVRQSTRDRRPVVQIHSRQAEQHLRTPLHDHLHDAPVIGPGVFQHLRGCRRILHRSGHFHALPPRQRRLAFTADPAFHRPPQAARAGSRHRGVHFVVSRIDHDHVRIEGHRLADEHAQRGGADSVHGEVDHLRRFTRETRPPARLDQPSEMIIGHGNPRGRGLPEQQHPPRAGRFFRRNPQWRGRRRPGASEHLPAVIGIDREKHAAIVNPFLQQPRRTEHARTP